ncbi:MAG TPA: TfoX/Sxy family protein [Alphaproteobacteria bacterium]|nr:TfoX/Sxy family protein [Alphaproteobacteria bacterium]
MAVSPDFLDYLRDQLEAFGPFDVRRMFGGAGLFRDGLMFALVADDALYLKVDDRNRPDFETAGMSPFSYERKGKTAALKSYYEAPPELPDDADEFAVWARKAFDAALAGAKLKR